MNTFIISLSLFLSRLITYQKGSCDFYRSNFFFSNIYCYFDNQSWTQKKKNNLQVAVLSSYKEMRMKKKNKKKNWLWKNDKCREENNISLKGLIYANVMWHTDIRYKSYIHSIVSRRWDVKKLKWHWYRTKPSTINRSLAIIRKTRFHRERKEIK